MNRREILSASISLAALGLLPGPLQAATGVAAPASEASPLVLGAPVPFSFDRLKAEAEAAAARP